MMRNYTHLPYLIDTHDYCRQSAGNRALFVLAQTLSMTYRYEVFVTSQVKGPHAPFLKTADEKTIAQIAREGVVIYPETNAGNKYDAKHVVRYLLNTPGFIRGDKSFPATEKIFAYSELLKEHLRDEKNILTVPVIDRNAFLKFPIVPRSGALVWKGKGKPVDVTPDPDAEAAREITFEWPESWAALGGEFRSAEILYTYHTYTALIHEARLCGCPVCIIPNGRFTRQQVHESPPWDAGIAWGNTPTEIERARRTVMFFHPDYDILLNNFPAQIRRFIHETQKGDAWIH